MALGITKIGEIRAVWTDAGRVLDRSASIRDAGIVPGFSLFGAAHHEADRAAVGLGSRLAVNWLRHHEPAAIMRVGQPASGVLSAGLSAHRGEQRIVEFLRPGDIVAPDHDVAEHYVLSSRKTQKTVRRRSCGTGRRRARSGLCKRYEKTSARRSRRSPSHSTSASRP